MGDFIHQFYLLITEIFRVRYKTETGGDKITRTILYHEHRKILV